MIVRDRTVNHFNLIRLILAILVLVTHAPELIDGNRSREPLINLFHTLSFGDFAVNGFFLLSGYLILQSWTFDPSASEFLKKRILRIVPAFFAATLVCAFIIAPFVASSTYFSDFNFGKFFLGMVTLRNPQIPPVFAGTYIPEINKSMWTIFFEFSCYLMVLTFGLLGIVKRPKIWLGITAIATSLLFLQKLGYLNLPNIGGINAMPRLFTCYLVGGALYLFKDYIHYTKLNACIAALILLVAMFSIHFAEIATAYLGGFLLIYLAYAKNDLLAQFNKLPDVSYGTYLYGWPTQKLLIWYFPDMNAWAVCISSLFIAISAGVVSWYLIEKPFIKLKSVKFSF